MRGFKRGSKVLCEKLKLKVQLCVVIGTNHVFDSKKLVHTPGRARVSFLNQIDTSQPNWYENAHETMQKELNKGIKEFGYS
jgi:1-acyl-sn-glycerol-3-phosphate acyltransferase